MKKSFILIALLSLTVGNSSAFRINNNIDPFAEYQETPSAPIDPAFVELLEKTPEELAELVIDYADHIEYQSDLIDRLDNHNTKLQDKLEDAEWDLIKKDWEAKDLKSYTPKQSLLHDGAVALMTGYILSNFSLPTQVASQVALMLASKLDIIKLYQNPAFATVLSTFVWGLPVACPEFITSAKSAITPITSKIGSVASQVGESIARNFNNAKISFNNLLFSLGLKELSWFCPNVDQNLLPFSTGSFTCDTTSNICY